MPLRFVNKDITKVPADIIVNPSDGTNFNENNLIDAISYAKELKDRYTVLWMYYDMFGGKTDES